MFIEEFNPNIMQQELNELHGYEFENELYEPTPEDWQEFSAWVMATEPEPNLDLMFEYFFQE